MLKNCYEKKNRGYSFNFYRIINNTPIKIRGKYNIDVIFEFLNA